MEAEILRWVIDAQLLSYHVGIIAFFLHPSTIDDTDDVVNGHSCLCNVGGQDYLQRHKIFLGDFKDLKVE